MARIVIALGGNALQINGETDALSQQKVARLTATHLVELIHEGHELIIVHGNGPQVGSILLHEETGNSPAPLDTCVAMSQGEIGYWLQQALQNELKTVGIIKSVATIVTQTLVAQDDLAFTDPTKPIGPFYPNENDAREAASKRQFVVKEDAGRGWRRVVASPRPIDIIEKDFILQSVKAGHIVIVAGGGGIPVVEKDRTYAGVEAVIDKDFAAAKVAELVDADTLLILTGVDAVRINFKKPDEQILSKVTLENLDTYINQGHFAPGSMLPKVRAAKLFTQLNRRNKAIITSPEQISNALSGSAGTYISNN